MKKLYNIATQKILNYPRNDDLDIVGLDANFIVLTQVDIDPPIYDSDTHSLSSNYIIDLDNKEYRQEWTITELPPPIPQPDWDGFNQQIFSNVRFNQVYGQCLQVAPVVASALPTAMDQITTRGINLFSMIFPQFAHLGSATAEDRLEWGQLARNANLPPEFIDIVEN